MNNKIKIILSVIILSLVAYIIGSTYSKYVAKGTDEFDMHIKAWNIKINDQTVRDHSDFTEYISIEYDDSQYIDANVIAPSKTGHFSVKVDYTGTEVPFEYRIETDTTASINIPDFRITGYKGPGDTDVVPLSLDNQTISGTIDQAKIDSTDPKNFEYQVYIEWYDEPDNTLDNFNDVVASKTYTESNLPIKFSVTEVLPTTTDPTPDPEPDPGP